MNRPGNPLSFFRRIYLFVLNVILIIPFVFISVGCSIQFTRLWKNRHEFSNAKVFERIEKQEEEYKQKTYQEEIAEVDSDREYQNVNFQVPPELMEKAEKDFYANSSGEKTKRKPLR